MKRLKSIVRKMWTGSKSAGRCIWRFLTSKEGHQMMNQIVLVVIKYILEQ
jgi:hypothetical protein